MKEFICCRCEDTGYKWDGIEHCDKCAKGKEIELKNIMEDIKYYSSLLKIEFIKLRKYTDKIE